MFTWIDSKIAMGFKQPGVRRGEIATRESREALLSSFSQAVLSMINQPETLVAKSEPYHTVHLNCTYAAHE